MGGVWMICCYYVFLLFVYEKGFFYIISNWFIVVILIFFFLFVEIKLIIVGIICFYCIWLFGKLIFRKKGFFLFVRL